jgi:hydrogenase maturation protein HypF
VQGVGFRPFIYRLAKRYNLSGQVENRNDCVLIIVKGSQNIIEQFAASIEIEAPVASNIESISLEYSGNDEIITNDFQIIKSENISDEVTEISPDIAICPECRKDMKLQKHRIDYPFINCTNCGPRFSIIKDLPYDREKTTMKKFAMCETCELEYSNILDRRFHAQPVACSQCGPEYELVFKEKSIKNFDNILSAVGDLILSGKIIAIKGIGGFHLACDAQNEDSVKRLRELKNREGKPFAVMFHDIETLNNCVEINKHEKKSLLSWRRPILLLKRKSNKSCGQNIITLARSVIVGFDTIGAMLPYMPFHFLLFETLEIPAIVLTSGNLSDEPIVTDNEIAKLELSQIADATLTYNRDIYNRTDDSVAMIVNDTERLLRRSRGYAPSPVRMNFDVEGIFAAGAELTNCFCVGKGNQAILSQHIGDLKNLETYKFYTATVKQFKKLFRVKPSLIVCDMHPDYLSTRYAEEVYSDTLNSQGASAVQLLKVQHHHAHIASCMAENKLDEKLIGVSFDGTGYGDDGNIWGSEFFVCDLNNYQRITHFDYVAMPGGDKATKEPWRMAVSYLYNIYGTNFLNFDLPFLREIDKKKTRLIIAAIDKNINCPLSCSAGRLFDAVAALLGICSFSKFHAEAPMRLESVIDKNCNEKYHYSIAETISFKNTFRAIISDLQSGEKISVISAKFHNTIIAVISDLVDRIEKQYGINKVALSGGIFQNRYILANIEKKLQNSNFKVYSQTKVPCNDGGIALGQLAIAVRRNSKR